MKKETRVQVSGYAVLGFAMLMGVIVLWNSRVTIDKKIIAQQEAQKPAEIELTLISPSDCEVCVDGNELLEAIGNQRNVNVLSSETFAADSEEGKTLLESYGIQRVPTVLVKGEYDKDNVRGEFEKLGGEEKDDALVLQVREPVYVDLASGQMVGLVDVTYLTDSGCEDCYDPTIHKSILEKGFGMKFKTEKTLDARSSEGRALLAAYAIKQTPTVLLSKEAGAYGGLTATWAQVGSVEEDGTLVFRKNSALGALVYEDLETGETVRPKTD